MFARSTFVFTRLCFYYRRVGFVPLPEKMETGGEDAFLSTATVQAVLDGVSWWRDNAQVDAGLYSAAFARTMYDYVEEDLLGDVPASSYRLLEKGYEDGKHGEVQGTCTALVATLQEPQPDIHAKDGYTYAELEEERILEEEEEAQLRSSLTSGVGAKDTAAAGRDGEGSGTILWTRMASAAAAVSPVAPKEVPPPHLLADNHLLDVAFVGDCSVMVLRDGRILYVSEEQAHDLDYPYQLGNGSDDTPADGIRVLVPVRKGDIVIMGSDGIFDNVYPKHIARIVWTTLLPVYEQYDYPDFAKEMGGVTAAPSQKKRNRLVDDIMEKLQECTDKVLEVATTFSKDIRSDTPYASKCVEGGALYEGGKPDDMTVLISVVGEEDDGTSGERFSGSDTMYPVPYRDWP